MHTCIIIETSNVYFQLILCCEKKKKLESCVDERQKRNMERMGGGGGQEIRYEEVGGIWVEMEISLSCFPFSTPALCISLSSSTPPLSRLLRVFGGRPSQSSRWPSLEPCSALKDGALPRGQWVCSGRSSSSEWASLQFHYSGNWLK